MVYGGKARRFVECYSRAGADALAAKIEAMELGSPERDRAERRERRRAKGKAGEHRLRDRVKSRVKHRAVLRRNDRRVVLGRDLQHGRLDFVVLNWRDIRNNKLHCKPALIDYRLGDVIDRNGDQRTALNHIN